MTEGSFGRRLTALAAVVAFAFAALLTRLWFLQVLAAEEYRDAANTNRVRLVPLLAPRGRILDRNGEPLVTNEPTLVITVDRQKLDQGDEEEVLDRLSELLEVPVWKLRQSLHDRRYLPYQPVPVYEKAPKKAVFYIAEHPEEFPGVGHAQVPTRRYTHRGLAPHLLGYLGEVSPEELDDPSFAGHLPGEKVGRSGVEQFYEDSLHGDNGWLKLEVNASGRTLGTLGRQEPEPGNDVWLSLDWEIQQLAQETLAAAVGATSGPSGVSTKAGSVVVLDPRNGHVLAMASFPSYNPNIFLEGVTSKELKRLQKPERNYPLNNRAIGGLYPPGSTFKPFVASAALKAGYTTTNSTFPCPPTFVWGGTVFRNWTTAHLGQLSLADSLVRSCDIVYYNFGLRFWLEREAREDMFQHHLRRWGFSRPTGIDIPGEQTGRIPDARWKKEIQEELPHLFPNSTWLPGDSINMSIGQGDVLTTPLQVAVAYSAIANGGTLYRPQVGMKVVDPEGEVVKKIQPRAVGKAPASKDSLAFLRQALSGVVQGNGTASGAFAGFPLEQFPVAGKTGTSEATLEGREVLHSWFAALAPVHDPRYVVVSVVEGGGHGSDVAAPVVRRVLEGLVGLEPQELNLVHEGLD